jgi:flagellar assembly protein FliH
VEAAKNLSDQFKPFPRKTEGGEPPDEAAQESIEAEVPREPFQFHDFGMRRDIPRGFKFDLESSRNFDDHNIDKARQGVKQIFADAMERIKAKAQEVKGEAHKEGYDAGYQDGFKAGEEAAKQEFTPFLETLTKGVEELGTFRRNMYPKVEREMIQMVVDLAKKIIKTDLAQREDSIRDMIRLAVASILDRESMVIRVNPRDKEHAERYSPELKALFPDIRNLHIEGHEFVQRGGCMVESNFGSVEANIDSLTDEIEKLLHRAPPPPEELKDYDTPPLPPEAEDDSKNTNGEAGSHTET